MREWGMRLTSVADLRTVYRDPRGGPIDKVINLLDGHAVEFLAKSPFFVLSTADDQGVCDGSPRGGPPGFVHVLDERHVAWPDYSGNNRLDSFQNLTANPSVAMLFMIPGLDETFRINGMAELHTDPELCERLSIGDRPAKVVVVVTVDEAYIHCAKSLRRAGLWSTDSWLTDSDIPSAAAIVRDHAAVDAPVEAIEEARDRDLAETLWKPGGDRDS